MKTYTQKMMDYLVCDGWDITEKEQENLEWWADEVWKLESNWSPSGSIAYLTFLVDPMHEGNRRKGESVWAIGCSKQYPKSREQAEAGGTISFGKAFKTHILEFQITMEALRAAS